MTPPRITANVKGPTPWSLHLTATPDYLNGGATLWICVDPPLYAANPEAARTAGWEVTATLYAIIARTGKIPADETGVKLLVDDICQWMNDALGRGSDCSLVPVRPGCEASMTIPWHLDWRGVVTARERAKWEEYDAVAHRVAGGEPLDFISMARSVEREIKSFPETFDQLVRGHRRARF